MSELSAANVAVSSVSITAIGGLAANLALLAYIPWRGGLLTNAHHLAKSTIHVTVLLAVLGASILVGVIPGSWPDENLPLYLTGALLDGEDKFIRGHLVIRNKLLIAASPPDATIERYLKDDKSQDDALRDHAVGLVLARRILRGSDFRGSRLYNAVFEMANLQSANLSDANLQGADLGDAHLQGAILINSHLQGADLRYAKLHGADLTKAKLQGADLGRASLQGAELSGANLQAASLATAYLQGVDLSFANLEVTYLSGANLNGADLSLAKLGAADLGFADVIGAEFGGVIFSVSPDWNGISNEIKLM